MSAVKDGTVFKHQMDAYAIRKNLEWATICVVEFPSRQVDSHKSEKYCVYGGEILIHSSFGSYGYSWNNLGEPFRRFLVNVDFGYLFSKLKGGDLFIYDGEKTFQEILQRVLDNRLEKAICKSAARSLWDALQDERERIESSIHDLVDVARDIQSSYCREWDYSIMRLLNEPWEYAAKKYDGQCEGFWRKLWPLFRHELQSELAQ